MFPNEEFAFESVNAPSGVPDQPHGEDQTFQGALNRAIAAQEERPEADYWVGLEGGIEDHGPDDMCAFAWMVVRGKDGKIGKGRTGSFFLPTPVIRHIQEGLELADADAKVFGRENAKHSNGTVGYLTGDEIDRTRYYAEAMVLALIPFRNETLY